MTQFKIGDRVELITRGEFATVIISSDNPQYNGYYGVRLDLKKSDGHNLDGACENGHGWWIRENSLRLANEKGKIQVHGTRRNRR